MRKLLFVFALVWSLATLSYGQGFNSVHSPNGVEVWAVGNGGNVFRSFDGGVTWGTYPQGTLVLYSVFTMNANVWIVGENGTYSHSSNNGETWTAGALGGGTTLRAIQFADATTGWVAGHNGTILKTTDGGVNWTPQTSNTTRNLHSLSFTSSLAGYAAGAEGTLLKTTDGGMTWANITDPSWKKDIYSVGALSGVVYVAGADAFCYKSTDDGTTWNELKFRTDTQSDVNDVFVKNQDSVFFIGGGGYIRESANSGTTFRWAVHPMHATLRDVFFYNSQRGWACSDKNNAIIRTTDGGVTWSLPQGTIVNYQWAQKLAATPSIGNTFSLSSKEKNRIYVALGRLIYMSTNRGETWVQTATISASSGSTHSFYVSPKDTNYFVVATTIGGDRVMRSTDRGLTWTTTIIRNYSAFGMPLEMDPIHPDTLYFAPEDTYLYRSKDFGATWDTVSRPFFSSPCDFVVVPDSANILWCGDSGPSRISRSTNAGLTWSLIYNGGTSEIPTIASSSVLNSVGFATAWGSGGVQKTTSFGAAWNSTATTSSTWGVDIAKDDPNVVMYGTYGGGTTYLSTNAGSVFSTSPISGSNYAILAYDRGTFFAQQSGGIWKYNITYTVPTNNAQAVSVVAPNGGESWQYNAVHNITWTSNNISNIKIEYRTGAAEPWQMIAPSVPASAGSYAWMIPNTPSAEALVRISDAMDELPGDVSNSVFSITAANISTQPLSLDFGAVRVGESKTDTIDITNNGTTTLVISSVTTGTQYFVAGRTSFTIPASSSDTLTVVFTPGAVQSYLDTLRINSNAPGSPTLVPLTGNGSPAVSVGQGEGIPTTFALRQNHPNPFNPSTRISYDLPEASYVSLKVYNTLGQEAAALVNGMQTAGSYSVDFSASALSSGVYFYRLSAGEFVSMKKMLLLK